MSKVIEIHDPKLADEYWESALLYYSFDAGPAEECDWELDCPEDESLGYDEVYERPSNGRRSRIRYAIMVEE